MSSNRAGERRKKRPNKRRKLSRRVKVPSKSNSTQSIIHPFWSCHSIALFPSRVRWEYGLCSNDILAMVAPEPSLAQRLYGYGSVNNNPESIAIEQSTAQRIFVEIAVPSSSPGLLTYESTLSPATTYITSPGSIVEVDVRGRPKVGVIIARTEPPTYSCKPILKAIWGQPAIPDSLLKLMLWVSQYYLCPLPRLIHLCAPGAIWKAAADTKRAKRYKSDALPGQEPPKLAVKLRGEHSYGCGALTLAPEQLAAVSVILRGDDAPSIDADHPAKIEFATTLLEGVTGSGKTEVYLACAKAVLALGRSVLVLVPEIALTPQMTMRFRAHFEQDLAVIHSGLTAAEV
jgi:primosomal protein N'